MQKPVTEGMTPEELREYQESVREARYGNPPNAWDCFPASGISKKVETHPMSDDLGYGLPHENEKIKQQEDHEVLSGRQNKPKQIKKWKQAIAKLLAQIEKIQADMTISTLEKQRKIARRQEIIENYKQDILSAMEYIEYQNKKSREIYKDHTKSK